MESKHNYESLTNELLFLNINGASRMVITFDERSSTEDGWVSLQHPLLILCGSCFRNIFDFHASSCRLQNGSPRGFLSSTRLFLVFRLLYGVETMPNPMHHQARKHVASWEEIVRALP